MGFSGSLDGRDRRSGRRVASNALQILPIERGSPSRVHPTRFAGAGGFHFRARTRTGATPEGMACHSQARARESARCPPADALAEGGRRCSRDSCACSRGASTRTRRSCHRVLRQVDGMPRIGRSRSTARRWRAGRRRDGPYGIMGPDRSHHAPHHRCCRGGRPPTNRQETSPIDLNRRRTGRLPELSNGPSHDTSYKYGSFSSYKYGSFSSVLRTSHRLLAVRLARNITLRDRVELLPSANAIGV